MPERIDIQWLNRIQSTVRQDPKKSGVLAVLAIVFVFVGVRAINSTAGGPARAGASIANAAARGASKSGNTAAQGLTVAGGRLGESIAIDSSGVTQKLRLWINEPIQPPTRNIFAVKFDYFPRETRRKGDAKPPGDSNDGDFWSSLEKSLLFQADQKEKRDTLGANYRAEAAKMRLDSIVMGPSPKAMIDGRLVSEGETIASFHILKIEARRIFVERDGFRFEIQMR